MPQGKEGTVARMMIKLLNNKVLLNLYQVWENEALLQGKWNEIYSFEFIWQDTS